MFWVTIAPFFRHSVPLLSIILGCLRILPKVDAVLDFVLVAECQRVLALVLADELADDCQLSVLVFFFEDVKVAKFETWHRLFVILFHII